MFKNILPCVAIVISSPTHGCCFDPLFGPGFPFAEFARALFQIVLQSGGSQISGFIAVSEVNTTFRLSFSLSYPMLVMICVFLGLHVV